MTRYITTVSFRTIRLAEVNVCLQKIMPLDALVPLVGFPGTNSRMLPILNALVGEREI